MTTDLQEAFREAARREFAMVPDEIELDYTFSPVFQRKMQRIIRAQVHGYWNMVNTVGKRIAIAAAIIVMLLTTAMAIKPIRERVIKFFVEVYDEYFAISFGEDNSEDVEPTLEPVTQYTFSWVPDGYYEVKTVEFDSLITTIWKNENGGIISLTQGTTMQTITLDHSSKTVLDITHESIQITTQNADNADIFVWEKDGVIFHLTVYDGVPIDMIIKMIDSLIIV